MKKFLAIVMSLVMVLAMSVTAFALVPSPSATPPNVVDYSNSDPSCVATLVLTPYEDADTLPTDKKDAIEEAYNKILGVSDLGVLSSALKALAASKNISVADLGVSDIFDLSYYESNNHTGHGTFTITLSADKLANFVALVHCVGDDWSVVESATVDSTGTQLTFEADDFSPFAIVVDKSASSETTQTSPQTSNVVRYVFIGAAVLFAGAAVCFFVIGKKKSAKA